MHGNGKQINLNYDRQKEFQKQQEKLKAISNGGDKVQSISADLMIENFMRDSARMTSSQSDRPDKFHMGLPQWLVPDSPATPPEYKYLWSLVQSGPDLADTQRVSQLLLTSGLHVDVLGYIWSLANKAVPGQLTKQEFFIVLALTSLAQTGCTFNNLSVLKLVQNVPLPVLQVSVFEKQLSQSYQFSQTANPTQVPVNHTSTNTFYPTPPAPSPAPSLTTKPQPSSTVNPVSAFNYSVFDNMDDLLGAPVKSDQTADDGKLKSTSNSYSLTSQSHAGPNFPCIGSSPTSELEDEFSEFQSVPVHNLEDSTKTNSTDLNDEFTDFQCAQVDSGSSVMDAADPLETVVISQKREIPKIPLPKSFSGKLTNFKSNIMKISPESERRLKVLSHNESLSSLPESKISSTNKVSTSITVLGSNHGIGSRLANHTLSLKSDKSKSHRHHQSNKSVPTPSSSSSPQSSNTEEEIIFGVKTKNLETQILKCCPKKTTTFLLKETKIIDDDVPNGPRGDPDADSSVGETTRQIEIPVLGTLPETVLPTQTKSQAPQAVDLISVQEDKYSALREIEVEMARASLQVTSPEAAEADDFGDFLSAEIPPPQPQPQPPSLPPPQATAAFDFAEPPKNAFLETSDNDNWGEWSCSSTVETNLKPESTDSAATTSVLPSSGVKSNPLDDEFDFLSLDVKPDVGTVSQGSQPFDVFSNGPSLPVGDDAIFDFVPPTVESTQSTTVTRPVEDDLWYMFSGPEPKSEPAVSQPGLSRHGSLQSLDLKMSATGDESEPQQQQQQEAVWRKCLTLCQNIIQEGVNTFDGIVKKSVLEEVFTLPKTSDYLNDLNVAYQISRRISQNGHGDVSNDLEKLWGRIEELCIEHGVKLRPDRDSVSVGESTCRICLGFLGDDVVSRGSHGYHPSCANLWVNCIDASLPCSSEST